ncbi:MAG: hypothetical protein ACI32N_07850 [Bulleidia sp.]
MDSRKALQPGCILSFSDGQTYTILNELARGGSGIVYHAFYVDNLGQRKTVRIKECYPFRCNLKRNEDMGLCVPDSEKKLFQESKERMIHACQIGNTFFHTDGLTNLTSNTYNIFSANNTLYVVSAYTQGSELSYDTYSSVKDCIAVVRSTASALEKIHDLGYLYLDLKPSNIFTLSGTTDLIQLFDFDTVIPMEEVRKKDCCFSFTRGYAALEQLNENHSLIGTHTDVYGIGALLYYLLFNRVPDMFDCECDAVYDYTKSRLSCSTYMDSLTFTLTDFFHHTLADYIPDRYADMHSVVQQLDELITLADETAMYVNSTHVQKPSFFIGRNAELKQFECWLGNEVPLLYVCGMEGMGKSTFVRQALYLHRHCIDCFVVISFDMDLITTINNDYTVHINSIHKDRSETQQEYFVRKCGVMRTIAEQEKCLLVIDDCMEMDDQALDMIQQCGWKTVLITSDPSMACEQNTIYLDALKEESEQIPVFENSLGRSVSKEEKDDVMGIMDLVGHNTLLIELIAKQIQSPLNTLDIHTVMNQIQENGIGGISDEVILYAKDETVYRHTLFEVLQVLFQQGRLSPACQAVMKALSLFGSTPVSVSEIRTMSGMKDSVDLSLLYRQGWIQADHSMVSLHPSVLYAVLQWEHSELSLKYAENIMDSLDTRVCSEREITSNANLYPHLFDHSRIVRHLCRDSVEAKNLIETEPVLQTEEHESDHRNLILAVAVLKALRSETKLCHTSMYRSLLIHTLFHVPFAYQEYLEQACMDYIRLFRDGNHCDLVKVYELLCDVLYDQNRMQDAKQRIDELKQNIQTDLNPLVRGRYHYLVAGYYDELLNGGYDAVSDQEKRYLKRMLKETDRAIRYLRWTKDENLLAECCRVKALVLIRSGTGSIKEAESLLQRVIGIVEHCRNPYTRLNWDLHMTLAWYDTYIRKDIRSTNVNLKQAYALTLHIPHSDIDMIEDIISPTANILFEWGQHREASLWLLLGCAVCEKHWDLPAYVKKQTELLSHLLEVCYDCYDMETCTKIMLML